MPAIICPQPNPTRLMPKSLPLDYPIGTSGVLQGTWIVERPGKHKRVLSFKEFRFIVIFQIDITIKKFA